MVNVKITVHFFDWIEKYIVLITLIIQKMRKDAQQH